MIKIRIKTGNKKLNAKIRTLKARQKASIVSSLNRGAKINTITKKVNAFYLANKKQAHMEFLKTKTAPATIQSQISRLSKKKTLTNKEWDKLNKLHRDYAIAQANRMKNPIARKQMLQNARERFQELKERKKNRNIQQRAYNKIKRKEKAGKRLTPAELGAEKPTSLGELMKSINRKAWKRGDLHELLMSMYGDEWEQLQAQGKSEDEIYQTLKVKAEEDKHLFHDATNGVTMYQDDSDNWYVIYNE